MDYKDISDDELMMLISEESQDAKDIMYKKYRYLISYFVKKYHNIALKLGVELSDLNQEALVGFSDGLRRYNSKKNASLKTFISLCIERRLQVFIIKSSRKKNQVLNEALSLEHIYQCFDSTLADIISDNNENNPLVKLTRDERYQDIVDMIFKSLSKKETDVLYLMLDGFDYQQIAIILDSNPKSIDNTINRIKNKVKDIIKLNDVNT
ncbi:MAG: sigma-70 family RNA polymerase sigma factor [Bacilli bacterium]|nr:sigma-70 family RNA polymerase sigma factor [Bacilli bacterium]